MGHCMTYSCPSHVFCLLAILLLLLSAPTLSRRRETREIFEGRFLANYSQPKVRIPYICHPSHVCLVQGPPKLLTRPNWLELQVEMLKVWWKDWRGRWLCYNHKDRNYCWKAPEKGEKMINKLVVLEPWPSTALMADMRRGNILAKTAACIATIGPWMHGGATKR